MRIDEVLAGIRFGGSVAENETDLERYFVRTPAFWDIVHDEVHVVLGGKGSGKTAIAKILTLPNGGVAGMEDIVAINAFATNANRLFRTVGPDMDERRFRALWMNYFVGVVGNHLVKSSSISDGDRAAITDLMLQSRLPVDDGNAQHIWRELTASVYPDGNASALMVNTPVLGPPRWFDPDFDFEPLLDRLIVTASALGLRYWIVLDRLDDAFSDRPALEVPALRGLLRAFMDLVDKGQWVRAKIFLPSDAFERIVEDEGFVNLDHIIDLSITLNWNHEELARLLSSRIATSDSFAHLRIPAEQATDVVTRVIPGHISYFTGRRHQTREALNWCIDVTQSKHDEPSPRNILDLLREARRLALTRLHSAGEEYVPGADLIGFKELRDGWSRISQRRLEGLYGENHAIRSWAESLRGQSAHATRATFRQRITTATPGMDPDTGLAMLIKSGIVFAPTAESLEVLALYIPALEIGRTGSRDDEYVIVADSIENSDQLRDRAKELGRERNFEAAVNILTAAQEIPGKNAVLAANLAIQSRDRSVLLHVDSFFRRPDFEHKLMGKRMVIKLALEDMPGAKALADGLEATADIYRAFGDFIGGLTSDGELEYSVWRQLCRTEGIGAGEWSRLAPVVAAMRVLAVARGRAAELHAFSRVSEAIVTDWFDPPNEETADRIDSFMKAYLEGDADMNAQFYPYQLVSLRYVRSKLRPAGPEWDEALAAHLAARLSSEDDEKQAHFRDWAAYSDFASTVSRRMAGNGGA